MTLADRWLENPDVLGDPLRRELVAVLACPTGETSAGRPFLEEHAWARMRDWVPHILADGPRVWAAVQELVDGLDALAPTPDERRRVGQGARVVRQVVNTAAITAPSDLWLLRYVLGALDGAGIVDRWRAGDEVQATEAIAPDLSLLLARGLLARSGAGFRWASGQTAQRVLRELSPLPDRPTDLSARWANAFGGDLRDRRLLLEVAAEPPAPAAHAPPAWVPTPEDIELGYRLVPIVLGLRGAGRIDGLLAAGAVDAASLAPLDPALADAAVGVLRAVGVVDDAGVIGPVGRRLLERGPGPFGIIEAYHPYMAVLEPILRGAKQAVHVQRGANVAASQDANRGTFRQANDALDRFCADTGFAYDVFVEHAVGRGEAIRQRYARCGDRLTYVGADLEDAAIAGALDEQERGHLPAELVLVRGADIARPEALVDAMRERGIDPEGAVMLVGNGFHEVRAATDADMVEVFRGYEAAGLVLLFTEASALPVDDLLMTAWNTYHAGFKYVHARSGQGLRPAESSTSRMGEALPASWTDCATRAGYVRAERWCGRSRTIYPTTPPDGFNPAISVNHFFVPARIAARLRLA